MQTTNELKKEIRSLRARLGNQTKAQRATVEYLRSLAEWLQMMCDRAQNVRNVLVDALQFIMLQAPASKDREQLRLRMRDAIGGWKESPIRDEDTKVEALGAPAPKHPAGDDSPQVEAIVRALAPDAALHLRDELQRVADQLQAISKEKDQLAIDLALIRGERDQLRTELMQWHAGGATEELLRRNDGSIKLARGCEIVRTADRERERALLSTATGLLEYAWGLIANSGGGDWQKEAKDWEKSAGIWRDRWHEFLQEIKGVWLRSNDASIELARIEKGAILDDAAATMEWQSQWISELCTALRDAKQSLFATHAEIAEALDAAKSEIPNATSIIDVVQECVRRLKNQRDTTQRYSTTYSHTDPRA